MVLNNRNNDIVTNMEASAEKFSINADASMFDLLSKKLYSNPVQSVVRELVSNAIDANIAAGTKDPIQVHFPNSIDPTFFVRDAGIGMDAEKLKNVFTYGGSDKRNTNKQIGGLGVGAKSPFSITDTFTVESTSDGIKRTAICFKGSDGCPHFKMIGEEESSVSGTKIYFNVDPDKFENFIYESVPVFAFAQQMPDILNGKDKFLSAAGVKNLGEFEKVRNLTKNDVELKLSNYNSWDDRRTDEEKISDAFINNVGRRFSGVIVNMGGVPYDVDISQVFDNDYDAVNLFRSNRYCSLILHMPIGSLSFQASREKLNYTEETKKKLQKALINFKVHQVYNNVKAA